MRPEGRIRWWSSNEHEIAGPAHVISADTIGIQLISNPTWYQLITLGLSWYHPARMYVYTRMQIPYAWSQWIHSTPDQSLRNQLMRRSILETLRWMPDPDFRLIPFCFTWQDESPHPLPFQKKNCQKLISVYQLALKNHLKRQSIRKQPRNTISLNDGNPNFYLGSCYFPFVSDRQWYDQLSWDCYRKTVTPGFFQTCWFNTIKWSRN